MSKELTPLKELGNIRLVLSQSEQIFNDIFATNKDPITPTLKNIKDAIKKIPIIETALKDYEELKIANSEQFKEKWVQDNLAMTFELTVAKPKLKALDTIREKRVDCNTLIFYLKKHNETGHIDYAFNSYNDYAKDSDKPQLTKEEFDSLKEVLL